MALIPAKRLEEAAIVEAWHERCAVELLYRTGISRAAARWSAGRGAIYMFHSIAPDRHLRIDRDLRTSPHFLDRLLFQLRASSIDIVTMSEVPARLQDAGRRRFVAITFDDGYGDNLTHALPVFEKHRVPLTVYVASGMITGTLNCWWIALERLFLHNSSVEVAPMQRRWILSSRRDRAHAYREVCDWVAQDVRNRAAALAPTFVRYNLNVTAIGREVGLTLDQFKALARHPLVTVGGHTVNHHNLKQLSDAEVCEEMAGDKRFIEAIVDQPIEHFAYPFGTAATCGPREASQAAKIGYRTAVTTRHECLNGSHKHQLLLLPRVGINRPYESIGLARLQIDGTIALWRRLADTCELRVDREMPGVG